MSLLGLGLCLQSFGIGTDDQLGDEVLAIIEDAKELTYADANRAISILDSAIML